MMYMEEMIIMKKITSFTIDHLRLIPGLYVPGKILPVTAL